jgi:guanyl-specific ribonuclease Sa
LGVSTEYIRVTPLRKLKLWQRADRRCLILAMIRTRIVLIHRTPLQLQLEAVYNQREADRAQAELARERGGSWAVEKVGSKFRVYQRFTPQEIKEKNARVNKMFDPDYDPMKNRLDGVRLDACAAALDDIAQRLDSHERSRWDSDEEKFRTAQNVWNNIIRDTIELRDYAISQGNKDKADIYQKILDKDLKKAGPYYRYSGPGSTARRDAETRANPPVSEKQRRAMRAAASGNSTLDIPKEVGEEFSEADPGGRLPESKRDATFGSRVAGKGGGVDMSARGSTTAYRGYLIKNVGNNNYTISRDGSHISYASSVENAKSQINELA